MKKKLKPICTASEVIEKISDNFVLDKYCKRLEEGENKIWKTYKDLTLGKYLKLTKKEQERIKTYLKNYYCPVEYLHEYGGKVYIDDNITWNDILSCKKDKILSFHKDQKRLIERCCKSPKCLIIDDYLPF